MRESMDAASPRHVDNMRDICNILHLNIELSRKMMFLMKRVRRLLFYCCPRELDASGNMVTVFTSNDARNGDVLAS